MSLNSNDISKLDFHVLWDISTIPATVKITNLSEGLNLAACTFWFVVSTGGGAMFHQGIQATPDRTGIWTDYTVPEPIPLTLGHIDWSGSSFRVKGFAKDSADNVFSILNEQRICRPAGNKQGQQNNFGAGELYIETKCEKARLLIEDKTNYSYNGNAGTMISKQIKLIYPEDATGGTTPPKTADNVNNAMLPISFSAEGYQVILTAVYDYVFTNATVRIKYKFNKSFSIQCNVDLCPLICDIERLEKQYEQNGCTPGEREKMLLINSKMNRAIAGKLQPLCGVDVAAIVDEIKKLGGFTCNCVGEQYTGINEISPAGDGLDCTGVQDCMNTLLNQIVPNCLSPDWATKTLLEKFTLIIAGCCCTPISGCGAPTELVQDSVTGTEAAFSWGPSSDPILAYEWVVYRASNDQVVTNGNGVGMSANVTGLAGATDYRFGVRAKCSANSYSQFISLAFSTT
jgi:hypothetical protein